MTSPYRPENRLELKFRLNTTDYTVLRNKLSSIMRTDPHTGAAGGYLVRSLYFDNADDLVYHAKQNGEYRRSHYRIRAYDGGQSPIFLEKKIKRGAWVKKHRQAIPEHQTLSEFIGQNRLRYNLAGTPTLQDEFQQDSRRFCLEPRLIIEYRREAYVFSQTKLRITLDKEIKMAPGRWPFFNNSFAFIRICPEDFVILEIKFSGVLPSLFTGLLALSSRPRLALSKYVLCRNFAPV